jgi:hypothetical protein
MTYEEWVETYKPIKNPRREGDEDNIEFDTHDDHVIVSHHAKRNAVWTWIDDNDGEPDYIISGYGRVNRLAYYITEVPYDNDNGDIIITFDEETEQ